jgi:hypothetical protein
MPRRGERELSSGAAVAGPGLALVAIDRSSLAVAIALRNDFIFEWLS